MRFVYPFFLILAAMTPLAGLFWSFLRARRTKALSRLTLSVPKSGTDGLQLTLIVTGLMLALVAAARPQWGRVTEKVVERSRNVVVAIDVSRSMLAEDVRPNRLERVKADVADLIDSLAGDRCSLVAFRRTGVVICPLTTDHGYLRSALEQISVESAPRGSTDYPSALRTALATLDPAADDHNAIILISDGEENPDDEGAYRAALDQVLKTAVERKVPVFTVGIGDPNVGSPIPADNGRGNFTYQGKPVMVRLVERTLRHMAEFTHGRYVPLATDGTAETTLGAIYRRFLRQVAAKEQNEESERAAERFEVFLVPALLLLMSGAALSRGRFARKGCGR